MILHGKSAQRQKVAEHTIDELFDIALTLDKMIVKSKLKAKRKKRQRQELAMHLAYLWLLRAAVEHRAGRTSPALTCMERTDYYLA